VGVRRLGVLVVLVLAVLALTASSAASRPSPTLTLKGSAPVIVDGAHFRHRERVKITASTGQSVTVRADAGGAFSVKLTLVPVDRCDRLIVRAQGSGGSVAVARRPPLPECLPVRGQGTPA
jgi:hypothetical protein